MVSRIIALLFLPILGWIHQGGGTGVHGGPTPTPTPPADVEFVTGITATFFSNVDAEKGMKITVGASNITVTELGIYGNSSHYYSTVILYIRDAAGTSLGNVTVTWGTAAQYYYTTLSSPVTLTASTTYYIMTEDMNFNDMYMSTGTTVTTTSAATLDGGASGQPPAADGTGANHTYGPLNFKYH